MKKLFIIIFFLFPFVYSFGQQKIIRSSASNTVFDERSGALKNFILPIYDDTIQANVAISLGLDSTGAIIITRDLNTAWIRVCCPKRWAQVANGGAVPIQFNPIAGSNISITGTYPNITFTATVSDAAVGTLADLRAIQGGAGSPLSKIVGTSNQVVTMLGKYVAGDNGVAQYYWSPASTATDDTLAVVKPTATSGAGRWLIVTSSRISAAQAGIKVDGTDQRLTLQAAVNNPLVKELIFESGTVTIAGKVTVPANKILTFRNGSMIKGDGGTADTLTGGLVEADLRRQVFDTTLTVLNLENNIVSGMWTGMKSDAILGFATPTNNYTPFVRALNAGKVGAKLYIPGTSETVSYFYYFDRTIDINKRIEVYGDGYGSITTLLFPGNTSGVKLSASTGDPYLHDLRVRGTYGSTSTGFNSNTAHGVWISSNASTVERVTALGFDGNGFYLDGNTGNCNSSKILYCRAEGNGRAGIYSFGSDANACTIIGVRMLNNARFGLWDNSFLGNTYLGGNLTSNVINHPLQKSLVKYRAAVSVGGNRYRATAASTNQTPPNASFWALIGVGGVDATFQAWSSSRTYAAPASYFALNDNIGVEPSITSNWEDDWESQIPLAPPFWNEWFADSTYLHGGGGFSDNANARNLFLGIYKEDDQPNFLNSSPSIVIGGFAGATGFFNGAIGMTNSGLRVRNMQYIGYEDNEASVYITKPDIGTGNFITMLDDASGGSIDIRGGSASVFLPIIEIKPEYVSSSNTSVLIAHAKDGVGSNPALRISLRDSAGTSGLVTQKLVSIQNLSTEVLGIAATGQITASFYGASGTRLIQTSNTGVLSNSIDPATIVTTSVLADSIDNRIVSVTRHAGTDSAFVVNYNGTETFAFLVTPPGAGIVLLNGINDATQTFAVGTTGTDFNISSVGTVHTFNIPPASATNTGLITTGGQTIIGVKTFPSTIIVTGILQSNPSVDNSNFAVNGSVSSHTTTASQFLVEGATGTNWRVHIYGSSATPDTIDYNYGTLIVGNSQVTEAVSGNANLISSIIVKAPTITGGPSTISNTATVYIEGAPTATVSGGNYSLWIPSGVTYFGKTGAATGQILFGGLTSGAVAIKAADAAGSITLTLPTAIVTNGYLKTDASGNLSFEVPSGAGTVTSITAGYGMNFTTITSTGPVTADSTVLVTKATQQVIAGQKNFTAGLQTLNIGIGTTQSSQFAANIGGSGYTLALLNASGSVTAQVGSDAYVAFIAGTIVENSSSTHGGLYGLAISAPIITAGAATVTNAATLYIGSAPSGTFTNPATGIRVVGGIRYDGSTSGYATINATPISGSTTLTLPAVTGTLVQYSEASITSSSTPSPTGNARENNLYITALATNATFAAPSGTVANGNKLLIRITSGGTVVNLSWNGVYNDGTDISLPSVTVANTTVYLNFLYSSTNLTWDLVGLTSGL